jgi:hypothetical protein
MRCRTEVKQKGSKYKVDSESLVITNGTYATLFVCLFVCLFTICIVSWLTCADPAN